MNTRVIVTILALLPASGALAQGAQRAAPHSAPPDYDTVVESAPTVQVAPASPGLFGRLFAPSSEPGAVAPVAPVVPPDLSTSRPPPAASFGR